MAEKHINAKGLQCPGPIMQLFNTIKTCESGDIVTIEVTDMGFKRDIEAWCRKTKNELLELKEENNVVTARIKKA